MVAEAQEPEEVTPKVLRVAMELLAAELERRKQPMGVYITSNSAGTRMAVLVACEEWAAPIRSLGEGIGALEAAGIDACHLLAFLANEIKRVAAGETPSPAFQVKMRDA